MATQDTDKTAQGARDLDKLNANLEKMEDLSQRLVAAMSRREQADQALQGPGQELYVKAAAAYMSEMLANPAKLIEHQVGYWGKALKHFVDANHTLSQGKLAAPADDNPADRRFKNPLWSTHPYFNFLKQQYQISAEAVSRAVDDMEELDPDDKQRVQFFARQIVDMMSPSNFLGMNPDALEKAVETDGQSLVDGMENLVRDIEANKGDLLVTLADKDAFRVGENLATTEGKVVFRNRLFELIQYSPRTETVKAVPLIIFPPWINKFYILDLKPANSLIRWVVEQGYTLFVVSWIDPNAAYADVALDTYIEEGYLTAIDTVKAVTGEDKVNAVGYCIAGTTLAMTLALMKKRGRKDIRSATFFTTMTDFSDQGEMGVFLDDDFVDGIERQVAEDGIMKSFFMARTFSFLRSNDLVYTPAIRSYMMGEAPPAFDLLYWNGDSTNLPGRMAVQYLRQLCQDNRFADGGITLCGETLKLSDVSVPLMAIACETDHIAAWKASFAGVQQMGSRDKQFILSESGHIAGIVNPPSKKKYGHYVHDTVAGTAEDWQAGATFKGESWWPHWIAWLSRRSGKTIPARMPGTDAFPALADAPGTYVKRTTAGDQG